jgi:hypothetical protein
MYGNAGGVLGWLGIIALVFGVLFAVYIIVLIIVLMSPKTPNKGTFLALFGGPLVYIYVGKWGKAIGLYIVLLITGGFGFIFLWPYSMVNIRTDVRRYLEDNKIREVSIKKLDLEIQKLDRELEDPSISERKPSPVQPQSAQFAQNMNPQKPVSDPPRQSPPTVQAGIYSLIIQINGNGTTVPNEGTYEFKAGTVVFISANPSEGWQFSGWIGQVTDPYMAGTSIEMNSDKTITALFQPSE